jgi:hypothetical protein
MKFPLFSEELNIPNRRASRRKGRREDRQDERAAHGELMIRNLQIKPRNTDPYWPDTYWYKSFDFTIRQIPD